MTHYQKYKKRYKCKFSGCDYDCANNKRLLNHMGRCPCGVKAACEKTPDVVALLLQLNTKFVELKNDTVRSVDRLNVEITKLKRRVDTLQRRHRRDAEVPELTHLDFGPPDDEEITDRDTVRATCERDAIAFPGVLFATLLSTQRFATLMRNKVLVDVTFGRSRVNTELEIDDLASRWLQHCGAWFDVYLGDVEKIDEQEIDGAIDQYYVAPQTRIANLREIISRKEVDTDAWRFQKARLSRYEMALPAITPIQSRVHAETVRRIRDALQ